MKRHETAVKEFMEGYRCSQAVLAAFAQDFDLDVHLARRISLPLAGGSGVGGECGAVSAAYLVIGLKYGFAHPGDGEGVAAIIAKTKAFADKFKFLHREIDCPKLIELDVFSEEGHRTFVEKNIKAEACARFVGDAVKILEEMLLEE
jgi:C_GCAxxG_C_C family probable redox protein